MNATDYAALKQRLVPELRFNQEIYEKAVSRYVCGSTVWLDAGCGKHILPSWREQTERILVGTARLAVGCDVDHASVREHHTLIHLVVADLEHLPFKISSVNLITCNMVVEHLDQPLTVFAELTRVLKEGGRLIVHTPNAYSYYVLGARFLPRWLKLQLLKAMGGRKANDVFPTRYRANTPRRLRILMGQAGLMEEWCRLLASDGSLAGIHWGFAALELLYIKLTLKSAFKLLRVSMLASFMKPGEQGAFAVSQQGRRPDEVP